MSEHIPTESSDKTKQRSPSRESHPASSQSFRSGLHPILQLQRTLGNQRVAQLIQAKRLTPDGKIIGLQPKLSVGAADDQYEQEADRVARQVVSMPDSGATASFQQAPSVEGEASQTETLQSKPLPLAASITPSVQRQTGGEEKMEENQEEDKDRLLQAKFSTKSLALPLHRQITIGRKELESVHEKPLIQRDTSSEEDDEDHALQSKPLAASLTSFMQRQSATEEEIESSQLKPTGSRTDSFEAGEDVESRLSQSKGSGSQLPDAVRTYMEPRFGVDFSHVRVHTGSDSLQMNQAIGAQAFTHGTDVYYGAGSSPTNLELTAHELTHVVQQTGGAPLGGKGPLNFLSTKPAPSRLASPTASVELSVPGVHGSASAV